jgi:uncharacterized protein
MKTTFLFFIALIAQSNISFSQIQSLEPIPLDDAWKQKIYELAPEDTGAPVAKKHRVLLFSLFTGFEHWAIPHVDYVMKTLGEKSGAYEVTHSNDIAVFEKKNLKHFDAVILNNNCSVGDRRNLFYDALSTANPNLSEEKAMKKAAKLESNLLSFVKKGGGLVSVHGGIVMQNNSPEFSKMLGGSFDYHPPQQVLELKVFDLGHPVTNPFHGKSFIHVDEAYFFKNAYKDKNFRPLLYMDIAKIDRVKHETEDTVAYVSWIKTFGKGRVFYTSPSHNAQSYENPVMLLFYLNGIQYALGDMKCDDSPIN